MKQFASFIKKEFYHIFRDSRTMLLLLAMPIAQLIIFGFAIATEIQNTPFAVLDKSKTTASQQVIEKLNGSNYFSLNGYFQSSKEIEQGFQKGKVKLALIFPPDFSNELQRTGTGNIQVLVDAADPNEASTIASYAQQILGQYQQSLLDDAGISYRIQAEVKMLYNPQLESAYNFVPGIMGLILMLICAMMTSISIVREKEMGTMEVLLVSPVKPTSVVLAKSIPYMLIAFIDIVSILLLSRFLLHVPIAGNIFLILLLGTVFTLSVLALGLMISAISDTQEMAMLISGVGLILPTMMLSGLIFPVESMPLILRIVSNIIPAKWFISAIKDVMIKGLGFVSIWQELLILLGMTVFLLTTSIQRFKNRL